MEIKEFTKLHREILISLEKLNALVLGFRKTSPAMDVR